MPAALTANHISKIFEDTPGKKLPVLKDISLKVMAGEFFILLGPSGSGKSTLLRVLSGLEKSFKGELVYGKGMSKQDISFVFQQFAILPWLTVFQNVELALLPRGILPHERKRLVTNELEEFGLEKFANSHPRELSGGMRQRVGLARAMVGNPTLIFMDEPFSELDSFTAQDLRQKLLRVWEERRPTIVMVTHVIEEALELADRIAVLTPLPGRIEKIINNILPRPRDERSPEFYRVEDQLYELVKP